MILLQLPEFEQLRYEVAHLQSVAADALQCFEEFFVAAEFGNQKVDVAYDQGERRLEFVTYIGEEHKFFLIEFLDLVPFHLLFDKRSPEACRIAVFPPYI